VERDEGIKSYNADFVKDAIKILLAGEGKPLAWI
jgi:hypothetical protein